MSAGNGAQVAEAAAPRGARSSVSAPPSGVTEVDLPGEDGLGWGWLAFTVRTGLEAVRPLVADVGEWIQQPHGVQWYGSLAKIGAYGSVVQWDPGGAGPERANEVHVELVQSDCEALGWERLAELARQVVAMGGHFSRADSYFDDRARQVTPCQVIQAGRAGQYVGHVKKESITFNGSCDQEEEASAVYVGSPRSARRLRLYDKDRERRVPAGTHGYRWELQHRDEWADWLVQRVLLVPVEERGRAFAAAITGLIDFRDRQDGDVHGGRAPRLVWWQQFVGDVERARMAPIQVLDTLVRRMKWVRHQVAPSLALLFQASGGDLDWLMGLMHYGRRRLRPEHWALLEPALRPPQLAGAT